MTKVQTAETLFTSGQTFTEGELASRLNTTRVGARSVVHQLRMSGLSIYLNKGGFDDQGRQRKSRYRLGMPKRSAVALAYKVAGSSLY